MTDENQQKASAGDSPDASRPSVDGEPDAPPVDGGEHTEQVELERTGSQPTVAEPDEAPPTAPRWSTPRPARAHAPGPVPAHGGPRPSGAGGPSAPAPPGGPHPAPGTAAIPTPTTRGPERRGSARWTLVAALVIGLVAGLVGGLAGAKVFDDQDTSAGASSAQDNVGQVAASALPGVVTLKVSDGERSGGGSGFVIRQDGYILTNHHVASAAGGQGLKAVFSDGTELPAKVVGQDASYDLAVVKVDKTGLKPLAFGSSDAVHVGDPVIAVGAPLGLESTVTTGIVSALDRPVVAGQSQDQASYINAIQTDAAINPGNSGGPLLDKQGRVVGINTAIARVPGRSGGGSQGNIGLGFAIPADTAKRTSEQLISSGKAERPAIGARLDLDYTGEGAKVAGNGGEPAVTPGGPADKAGLKEGDLILRIDGRRVPNANMLIVTTRSKAVGDTVKLLVRSGDSERTVDVVLASADDD